MPRDELITAIRDAYHFGSDQDRVELTLAFIRELADAADTLPLAINHRLYDCLLYTSDAADERSSVDLGGRRIIKKKKKHSTETYGDRQKKKMR